MAQDEAVTNGLRVCELTGKADGALTKQSLTNEHYTPNPYLVAARKVLGAIDLDPASNAKANRIVKAKKFFTLEDDGLLQDWFGRVWLNPPYGGKVGAFIAKFMQGLDDGDITAGIILVNSQATDTAWFQPLFDGTLCFTDHRISFYGPTTAKDRSGSTHGSVFVYFGKDEKKFVEVFKEFGAVVRRVEAEKDGAAIPRQGKRR